MLVNADTALRAVSFLMLAWLAIFFSSSLRPGRQALITRIARVSDPALPPHLVGYTRRLTAVWSAYFVLAALLTVVAVTVGAWIGVLAWIGSATLFLGEYWLRPYLFPGHPFPGLRQQLQDTLSVWRPGRQDRGDST